MGCRRRWGLRRRRSPRLLHDPILADPSCGIGRGGRSALTSCRTGAGAGPPPAAPSSVSSGGATTVASGPRATSNRSSHAGSLMASTTRQVPSSARVADSWGWLSTTHSAAGASRSVTRGSSGRGRYTRSRASSSSARDAGSKCSPVARTARTRSTRNSRSSSRAVAPRGDVPGAERVEHPPRVDDAGGHLVACERVVVDLDALVVGFRVLQSLQLVAGADVDREAARARRGRRRASPARSPADRRRRNRGPRAAHVPRRAARGPRPA